MTTDSEAPRYTLDESAAKVAHDVAFAARQAASGLVEAARAGNIEPSEAPAHRVFISPIEPNSRFLVIAGKLRRFPDPNSPTGYREYGREGDVFARFAAGSCVTNDPIIWEWCEAHSGNPNEHRLYHQVKKEDPRGCSVPVGLCRDAALPGVKTWAELKELQVATAKRPANVSNAVDLDAFLNAGLGAADSRLQAENAGSRFVATAEAAANAARERAQGGNRDGVNATYLPGPWVPA